MKPWLKWTLIVTLGLSAWAILFPAQDAHMPPGSIAEALSPAAPASTETLTNSPPAPLMMNMAAVVSPSVALSSQLPVTLPQPSLEPANFDPFVGVKPPAPPPAPVVVAPLPAPLVPQAPPLNYRFMGRVVDPDGKTQIYLSRADKDVLVAKGTHLDEGYDVEGVKPDAVLVYYPPLDLHTQIRIPTSDATP